VRFAVVVAALVAGCYDPDPPLGIPCADTGECPTGQQCDVATLVCMAPTELRSWRDDTADDFAGGTFGDSIVEAAGFVGPVAYAHGRVRLTGVDGDRIAEDPAAATWDAVSAGAAGIGFSKDADIDFGLAAPDGLGVAASDNVTVLVEGEIDLDAAGSWRFELTANDAGFFELAPPGGDFMRLANDVNTGTIGTYDVTTPGWYRFRAAFSDANQYLQFALRYDPPNVNGAFRTIPSDRLRCRVDDLQGYVADGFDQGYLVGYQASTLLTPPLDLALPADPYGLQIGASTFSVHFAGQILVDVEGDYAFNVTSHHGHRVWLDGQLVADSFTSADATTDIPATHLAPGWHDVIADVTKSGDDQDATLSMKVTSGPTWVDQTIPIDHVRPALGRVGRWTGAWSSSALAIPDASSATRFLSVELPADATPLRIDATYEIDHPVQSQVSVVLDPPVGGNITMLSAGALGGAGTHSGHIVAPTQDAGTSWSFIAADDNGDGTTGNLTYAAVTIIYTGGGAPFPTSYRYESVVKDLGNVVGFGAVTWTSRQGDVKVQLRTCDAACTTEPWVDVENNAVPSVVAKQFAQYAVDFASDGDVPTAFDSFELSYTARP
jgi:hypothetical protein